MESILIVLIIIFVLTSIAYYSWLYGISPTPSPKQAREEIIKLIPKKTRGKIVELGAGWGSLAIPLAQQFPFCQVRAYEISLIPWFWTRTRLLFSGLSNLYVYRQDFFEISLKEIDVVVCYLYPGAMRQLKEKFEKELKSGALVLSYTFAIPGWTPQVIKELNDLYHSKIYFYQR
jgi:hypothetical protein